MLVEEIVGLPISEDREKTIQKIGAAAYLSALGLSAVNGANEIHQHFSAGRDDAPMSVTYQLPPPTEAEPAKQQQTTQQTKKKVNEDEWLLALTIWGEARNHGEQGMRAVGHVINNRAKSGLERRFGEGIKGVVWKSKQFSCWNPGDPNRDAMRNIGQLPEGHPDRKAWSAAKKIAKDILRGESRDPTKGALFYHTTDVNPVWNKEMLATRTVANHVFYKGNDEVIGAAKRAAARLLR